MSTPTSAPRVALLRAEEEVELALLIEAGRAAAEKLADSRRLDPVTRATLARQQRQGQAAFERFVTANTGLAYDLAWRRFAARAGGNLDLDDLRQEAMLGVIRAVQKFDPHLGFKFSTYATNWIKQFMGRAVANSMTGITVRDAERLREYFDARETLAVELQRQPTVAELARRMDTTGRDIVQLQAMAAHPVSLDSVVHDSGQGRTLTRGDTIAAATDDEDADPRLQLIPQLLAELPTRERAVVADLFGLDGGEPATVAQIASRRGVPIELVARTAEAAMLRLRGQAGVDAAADGAPTDMAAAA